MKKLGILFMVMVLAATVSTAQNRRGGQRMSPEDRAKETVKELKENVGLEKDQEKKVYDLSMKYSKKMQALREEMGGGFSEEMREKFGELREEQNKEMKKVLSEKQWDKYEKYQEKRMQEMRQRRNR